jgi:hypothetical protein
MKHLDLLQLHVTLRLASVNSQLAAYACESYAAGYSHDLGVVLRALHDAKTLMEAAQKMVDDAERA